MVEHADNRTYKLLIIAGADNERGIKAGGVKNPSARIVVHQNAANRDNLIEKHFSNGREHTLAPQQSKTSRRIINRRSLQDPMEWE